jgi:hypothetical protein
MEAAAATVEATSYGATTTAPATTVAATASVPTTTAPTTTAPTVTVPGASPDEYAAVEPLWAIVAIGGTAIGRVPVVAVLAYGRTFRVPPTDVDSK